MTDLVKPHKGTIDDWWKLPKPGLGLGYAICGHSADHPEFGNDVICTSYVVKHDGAEVETRNSRYTLTNELEVFAQ